MSGMALQEVAGPPRIGDAEATTFVTGVIARPLGDLMLARVWNPTRLVRLLAATAVLAATGLLGASPAVAYPSAPVYENNQIVGLGQNSAGQLGDGTYEFAYTLVRTLGLPKDVRKVVTGLRHTLALDSAGNLWAWGSNLHGRLGDGTTADRITAVRLYGVTNVTQVATGSVHTIALRSDGTVWTWGYNIFGQLGDGTTDSRAAPTRVPGITTAVAVGAGTAHSIALLANGTVLAWGHNVSGQLGDGTVTDHVSPTPVYGISTAVKIAAGGHNNSAVLASGQLVRWGANHSGQLGIGDTSIGHLTPVYPRLTNVVQIADNGASSAFALTSDGRLWGWGYNGTFTNNGVLGDGTHIDRHTPLHITGAPTGIIHLAAGLGGGVVVTNAGRVWNWGLIGGQVEGPQYLVPTVLPGVYDAIHAAYSNGHLHAVIRVPLGIG